jgi:peptidoglycan/LPS O-acetylase OafA/YrhL
MNTRLESLDAARGVAILLVLASHFIPDASGSSLVPANAGVILFFFLSGFLMDRNLAQDDRIAPFAIRRGFRLLPIYWASIALALTHGRDWTVTSVLANATFTAPVVGAERFLGVYWTLYIEVLFYALAPFLRMAGDKAILAAPYLFIALLGFLWVGAGLFNAASFYLLFCFAGMQIGLWYRGQLSAFGLAASLVAVSIASSAFPVVNSYLGLAPLACGALVWLALRCPFRSLILEWVGKISYSLYLMHTIAGYAAMGILQSAGCPQWAAIGGGVIVSFVTAYATYKLIEKPGIRLGRALANAFKLQADRHATKFSASEDRAR